ncbi:DUF4352 domain-containing protein [Streptomyces sp. NPDC002886]|uniref:DUF4352 domain-containing protein n=1 Tax=Streptomyces sp. NPDC002886 TaxID=3364667 RepID=UPI0036993AA9
MATTTAPTSRRRPSKPPSPGDWVGHARRTGPAEVGSDTRSFSRANIPIGGLTLLGMAVARPAIPIQNTIFGLATPARARALVGAGAWCVRSRTGLALILVAFAVLAAFGPAGTASAAPVSGQIPLSDRAAPDPGIGKPVRDGKFEFTVTRLQQGGDNIGGSYGADAQGRFLLVHVTVRNIGDQSQTFDGSDQKLFDAKNRRYNADTGAAIYLKDSHSFLEAINPGNQVKAVIVFDLPTSTRPVRLELHDSLFSGGVTVDLIRHEPQARTAPGIAFTA